MKVKKAFDHECKHVRHTKAIELIHVSSSSVISPNIPRLSLKAESAVLVQLKTDPKAKDPKLAISKALRTWMRLFLFQTH